MTFAARLLSWFDDNRRDLPWRRTRDPWAIWVSEVMLQQTRVEAVRDSFTRFLARYPTPAALAAADDDALHAAWRGLGYYRRARLLRDGARAVVADHGGVVPRSAAALGTLPGIGRYTRGAIASIAFGEAVPAIDGNVERVVARHRGITAEIRTAAARLRVEVAVTGWLPADRAGDFNQAMMELGALICSPRSPDCGRCPVRHDCVARREGTAAALPVRKAPPSPVEVAARAVLVRSRRGVLGARVPVGEPNAGQVELPGGGILVSVAAEDLAATLQRRYGARLRIGPELASVRHAITRHRITLTAHGATVGDPGTLGWWAVDDEVPWTTAARKVFAKTAAAGA